MLSDQLEQSKSNLFDYFNKNYANTNIPAPSLLPSTFVQSAPMAAGSLDNLKFHVALIILMLLRTCWDDNGSHSKSLHLVSLIRDDGYKACEVANPKQVDEY